MPENNLLTDPWCVWPDGFPYAALADGGVELNSSMADIRQAYFELMEWGHVDDCMRRAYDELRILPRRLLVDALLYDANTAEELLEMLAEFGASTQEAPLNLQVPMSWDV